MKNRSKQTVFIIVGLVLLIVTVFSVSFAFFSYAKNGTTNNVIKTGKVDFTYSNESALSLSNQFPQDAASAIATASKFKFTVKANIPSTVGAVTYKVYGIKGDTSKESQGFTRMADGDISLHLTTTAGAAVTLESPYKDTNGGAIAGSSETGFLLATSTIQPGQNVTHEYELQMWVNDTVKISDSESDADYCASADSAATEGKDDGSTCVSKKPVYSKTYYSLKVKVEASDNAEVFGG